MRRLSATSSGPLLIRSVPPASENSGGKLGKLKHARLGVFQIVAQNSSESYTWSGAYNTTAKNKTGAVTVKLEYALE